MWVCILFKRSVKFRWYELCYPPPAPPREESFLSIFKSTVQDYISESLGPHTKKGKRDRMVKLNSNNNCHL